MADEQVEVTVTCDDCGYEETIVVDEGSEETASTTCPNCDGQTSNQGE